MYLVLTFVFFILGGTEALLMRLQLSQANNTLLDPKTYNELFTMHGTTMVFLFVVPIMAGFGNYFVPLMIGARDMAYPKLNALSFWLLVAGGLVFYGSVFFNPPECGWTCYPPLSSSKLPAQRRRRRVDLPHPPHGPELAGGRHQLLRHDRQHARAGHGLEAACRCSCGRS
jgi:heme/copper-type cytochrome/quinol oxidase subunit 1